MMRFLVLYDPPADPEASGRSYYLIAEAEGV